MMALAGIELETLVSEPDALTTRPPPCADLPDFISAVKCIWLDFRTMKYPERNIYNLWYLAKYQIKQIYLS